MSNLLLLSVLCGYYLVLWVGAFPSHRGHAKLPMPAISVRRGRDNIPARTISPQYHSSGDDLNGRANIAAVAVSAALDNYGYIKSSIDRMFLKLPKAMTSFPVLKNYVRRLSYEKMVQEVYNSCEPYGYDSFTIVAGPRGGGKTTLVEQELSCRSGVLRLDVTEADTVQSIFRKVLMMGGERVGENILVELNILPAVFLDVAEKLNGRRITVVLMVEFETPTDDVFYMVKSAATKLARFANVIVVLSEATAVLRFDDYHSHKFIWVDEMTHEEATKYAKKLFPAVADYDLKLYFDKVRPPTHPIQTVIISVQATQHPY